MAKSIIEDKQAEITYYVEIKKYKQKSQSLLAVTFPKLKQGLGKTWLPFVFCGVYHEKGVDVQIAVCWSYQKKYDKCYLISSDTDLLQLFKLPDEGKQIIMLDWNISRALLIIIVRLA